MIKVTIIPVLNDNYAYLVECTDGSHAIVDPGEARPIDRLLHNRKIKLDYILNTHHHGDHIAGNKALKESHGARLVGPSAESQRIPDIDIGVHEGHPLTLGGDEVHILETPGHTSGGICYYFPASKTVFTGDTLFAMGCGRLFEGTADEMWGALCKIMALPDDTLIYCGHEYTLANGEFCLRVDPHNEALHRRMEELRVVRKAGRPTLPSTVALEKATNCFVRAGSAERFAEIRKLKG